MVALTGTRRMLRAMGVYAVRGLAAVEPRSLNRHAQRNAASALTLARAVRLEAAEADLWSWAVTGHAGADHAVDHAVAAPLRATRR